jgi:hypothetical protein
MVQGEGNRAMTDDKSLGKPKRKKPKKPTLKKAGPGRKPIASTAKK